MVFRIFSKSEEYHDFDGPFTLVYRDMVVDPSRGLYLQVVGVFDTREEAVQNWANLPSNGRVPVIFNTKGRLV